MGQGSHFGDPPPPPVDEMNVLRLFYAKLSVGATHTHQWSRRSATDMIKAQEFILLVCLYLKQIPQKIKKRKPFEII